MAQDKKEGCAPRPARSMARPNETGPIPDRGDPTLTAPPPPWESSKSVLPRPEPGFPHPPIPPAPPGPDASRPPETTPARPTSPGRAGRRPLELPPGRRRPRRELRDQGADGAANHRSGSPTESAGASPKARVGLRCSETSVDGRAPRGSSAHPFGLRGRDPVRTQGVTPRVRTPSAPRRAASVRFDPPGAGPVGRRQTAPAPPVGEPPQWCAAPRRVRGA
jgi:hypothetical protein